MCGRVQKKELSERLHRCPCGYIEDRDVAAAQVVLNWVVYYSTVFGMSIVKRGELSSTSTPTYCGGLRQLGSKKRKKHSLLDGNLETPFSRSRAILYTQVTVYVLIYLSPPNPPILEDFERILFSYFPRIGC